MNAEPRRVVGYCRVSTEEQALEGVSLEAQEEKIRQYASLYQLELIKVYSDPGLSGRSLDRPGLQRALKVLEAGRVAGLVVAKLDRLTRRVADLAVLLDRYFKKDDVHLLSVNEQLDTHTASGRLLVHILASVAEWERETIAERVRDALHHLRANGVRLGGTGLGWTRGDNVDEDGRLIIEKIRSEQETIDRILELHRQGKSLRQIVKVLGEEGRATKRGGHWQAQTIANIIRRGSNA